MYAHEYRNENRLYYPEVKQIKIGKRIFPYNFTEDGDIMNINNVRFLGKGCNIPYLTYMYLQFIKLEQSPIILMNYFIFHSLFFI